MDWRGLEFSCPGPLLSGNSKRVRKGQEVAGALPFHGRVVKPTRPHPGQESIATYFLGIPQVWLGLNSKPPAKTPSGSLHPTMLCAFQPHPSLTPDGWALTLEPPESDALQVALISPSEV